MTNKNNGGPAFPTLLVNSNGILAIPGECISNSARHVGMSLRDYFAAHVQEDDRLVKCVRAMDDTALEIFALYPSAEREEHITETPPIEIHGANLYAGKSEVEKVAIRLTMEAKAIARVRYMQADAMIAEREQDDS